MLALCIFPPRNIMSWSGKGMKRNKVCKGLQEKEGEQLNWNLVWSEKQISGLAYFLWQVVPNSIRFPHWNQSLILEPRHPNLINTYSECPPPETLPGLCHGGGLSAVVIIPHLLDQQFILFFWSRCNHVHNANVSEWRMVRSELLTKRLQSEGEVSGRKVMKEKAVKRRGRKYIWQKFYL